MTDVRLTSKVDQIWIKAEKHKKASIVGLPLYTKQFQVCSCCDQAVQKEPISMWEHTKQFERYGFGYPLWFSFLKYCIILVLILIASKTANQLYMASNQNYDFCYGNQGIQNQKLNSNTHNQIQSNPANSQKNTEYQQNQANQEIPPHNIIPIQSTFQKLKQALIGPNNVQNIQISSKNTIEVKCTSFMVFLSIFKGQKMYQSYFLKVVQFIIHLCALICIRNMILKQEQYYDERTTLISNYSIIIHNLPNVQGMKRKIQNLLEQEFGMVYNEKGQNDIKQFIYVYKDEQIEKIEKQIAATEEQILISQKQQDPENQDSLRNQLCQLEGMLQKEVQRARIQIDKDKIKCNKVILIMATQGDKASILYTFKEVIKEGKQFSSYFYDLQDINDEIKQQKNQILIKEAPQPNEIIWQHIDESDQKRKMYILQGWIFTFLFLGLITVVFYFIMLAKTHLFIAALQTEEEDPNDAKAVHFKVFATFILFIALFGVVLFNKFVLGKVLHVFVHLEHHAYTDKQNHSFALKYALGMFFTTALMTLAVQALTYKNFYTHQYGVIEQETIMFFVTAFIIPLIWFINPYNICAHLRRLKQYGKFMSQQRANRLVQNYPYVLGKRYAQVFQIMWFTFLYSQLIPIGSFLVLIGLILYFWVDKYNFLRRSTINTRVSGKMAILGLKSLDATLFLSPAGQLLFDGIIRGHFNYLSLIFTIIGIVYVILPVTSFIWQMNGQKFIIQQKPYQEAKKTFRDTYVSLHPIYKLTHQKQILQHREQVLKFYKQDVKKIKLFGQGRGKYRRQSAIQSSKMHTQMLQTQKQTFTDQR